MAETRAKARALRFSSLYIGILAATELYPAADLYPCCFSSLYIGILAATGMLSAGIGGPITFQFPLHRDPRCNEVTK